MKTIAAITLTVPPCSQGLHLRWYANGWHYLTLKLIEEAFVTAGLFSNTEANSKQKIAVEDISLVDMEALISLALTNSFDVLTPNGWRNGTFDGGDITASETDIDFYRAEFTLNVYGKTYRYSPQIIAPPVVLTDLDILRQIREANPTSQLPALWLDSEDPYTQWAGVVWADGRVMELNVSNNSVSSLANVTGLAALEELYCDSNQLSTLNVTGLTALRYLYCDSNQLSTLNVTGLTALQYLACDSNQLTTLDVTGLTALRELYCGDSQLSTLNVTGLTALQYLDCNSNQLTSLNVTGLTALQYLYCHSNQLTTLDVTGLTALQVLYCHSNQLTTLDVTGLTALQYLDCQSNQLTTLDVTGLTALQVLYCHSNQLTTISTLISKGSIIAANFTHNKMLTPETNRLLTVGFTSAQVLPQDI